MTRRKKYSYPYPIVEVLWEDAESDHGWESPEETKHDIPEVWTVGFLIHEDEKGITIASTACKEKTTNSRLKIPRGMIKEMKPIK